MEEERGWHQLAGEPPSSQGINATRETRIYLQNCEDKLCQALRFEMALLAPHSKDYDPQNESEEAAMKLWCAKNCLENESVRKQHLNELRGHAR